MTTTATNNNGAAPAAGTQAPVATQKASENNGLMKRMQEETCTSVLNRINAMQTSGELKLPEGYNVGNALKSAWLYLQTIETKDKQKAIDFCTTNSICNCLLQMAIKGEYPMQHCYFIPCGKSLEYWERYTGRLMRAKRDAGVANVNPQVIYDGDSFVYTVDENGEYQLVKHETELGNIDIAKIKGAYAVVIMKDGSRHLEIMTIDQIRKAWGQGAAKGNSGAHVNFTDQMAKKTVIGRACKIIVDSAEDGDDFSMTPPSAEAARRDDAQNLPPYNPSKRAQAAQADSDAYEDAAKYEVVKDDDNPPTDADQADGTENNMGAEGTQRKRQSFN